MKMKTAIRSFLLAVVAAATFALPGSPLVRQAAAAEQSEAKVTLHVDGMTCASCSVTVRVTLERLDGVKSAAVSFEEKRARVTYDSSKVTPKQMIEAVSKAGYKARVASEKES